MARITYLTGIEFGTGAIATLPEALRELGIGQPLLVADRGVQAAGLLSTALSHLPAGLPVFLDTPPNPTEEAVAAALAIYRERGCDGVIALGGGALLNPETRSVVKASGTLVYLSANPEQLLERLESTADTRPLLEGLTPEQRQERIRSMLGDRRPIYESADLRVETDGLSPSEVTGRVRALLQERQS